MEKADIVWGGKACGVVQALSLADSGRIRALAVNEDPDDVTTRSYVSAGHVSNKSQAFYLAGLSTTTHGAQFAFSRFGIRSEVPWCITLDNSKGISRLRFWAKNSRANGINDLPVFMHQGTDPAVF